MINIRDEVLISARPQTVWSIMADPSGWGLWSTAVVPAEGAVCDLVKGCKVRFTVSFYGVHLTVEPEISSIEEGSLIVWTGSKFGVYSHHEFRFIDEGGNTRVTSEERLSGLPLLLGPLFPEKRIEELTRTMLLDLKKAAEAMEGVT